MPAREPPVVGRLGAGAALDRLRDRPHVRARLRWGDGPVLAFTPYVAITALVPLAAAAALRVWPAAVVTSLAAVALLIAVVPRGFGGETDPAGDPVPPCAFSPPT